MTKYCPDMIQSSIHTDMTDYCPDVTKRGVLALGVTEFCPDVTLCSALVRLLS